MVREAMPCRCDETLSQEELVWASDFHWEWLEQTTFGDRYRCPDQGILWLETKDGSIVRLDERGSLESPAVLEGRTGRARGEYAGMFVQVDQDPTQTGWHIWLSDADPRDGPLPEASDAWDIWADDEHDVWEWLGPEQLDVEWIQEP